MPTRFIGTEATGIYVGTLVEDMIDTVKREKKLYCNVHIEDLFQKDTDYPLTYVPFWAMSLPLREGDKVLVEFHQGNLMYPVLYKNPDEIDTQFFEQFDTNKSVTGGNIQGYQAKDTVGAFRIGVDSYVIKTDDYTVIHQNNGFILIDKDDKHYIYGSEINVISDGTVNVDSKEDINIYTSKKIVIKSDSDVSLSATRTSKINVETQNGDISVTAGGTGNINIKASGTGKVDITSGVSGVTINNHLQVTV